MAANGVQTWQRFDWLKQDAPKRDQIRAGDQGRGLMETLNYSPDGARFVMAGRMAQGKWNAAVFDSESGNLIQSIDSKSRVTTARFSADGDRLYLAGAKTQEVKKGGESPDYGKVTVYQVNARKA